MSPAQDPDRTLDAPRLSEFLLLPPKLARRMQQHRTQLGALG
jgi:hypothetical protein